MNTYTRSSKTRYYTKEENQKFYSDYRDYIEKHIFSRNMLTEKSTRDIITRALLDSSLISQTKYKTYTHKVIRIGDYYQIYDYNKIGLRKDNNLEKNKYTCKVKGSSEQIQIAEDVKKEYDKFNNNPMYIQKSYSTPLEDFKHTDMPINIKSEKKIDIKNINRAKFELQRIVKANEQEFKTFITLTFEQNITSIEEANKKFNSFRTYIKRLKSDFKYVCVPEFQKRGAVHYHLLTNIDYTDFNLLSQNEIKLWNKSSRSWQVGRNIIGWSSGYSLVKNMEKIEIIGYITKYMTKDIDNRLWGKRRYLYSQNLIKPIISYIDVTNIEDFSKLVNITSDLKVAYKTSYKNIYNETVDFIEYKKEFI